MHSVWGIIDKKWFFSKWNLNLYLDIENIYNNQASLAPSLIPVFADDGSIQVDPTDPTRYLLRELPNTSGTVLPTIGLIIIL